MWTWIYWLAVEPNQLIWSKLGCSLLLKVTDKTRSTSYVLSLVFSLTENCTEVFLDFLTLHWHHSYLLKLSVSIFSPWDKGLLTSYLSPNAIWLLLSLHFCICSSSCLGCYPPFYPSKYKAHFFHKVFPAHSNLLSSSSMSCLWYSFAEYSCIPDQPRIGPTNTRHISEAGDPSHSSTYERHQSSVTQSYWTINKLKRQTALRSDCFFGKRIDEYICLIWMLLWTLQPTSWSPEEA